MAKYSLSEQTQSEAMGIAKSAQTPAQSKEQTKLIAQGIAKGIDLYKKQQKAKQRELNKALKKAKQPPQAENTEDPAQPQTSSANWLPWTLLGLSWLGFAIFVMLSAV